MDARMMSICFLVITSATFVMADVEWDPIQQLTLPAQIVYGHAQCIGSFGDSIYVAYSIPGYDTLTINRLCLARSFDGGENWDTIVTDISLGVPALAIGTQGELHCAGFGYRAGLSEGRLAYARSMDAGSTWTVNGLLVDLWSMGLRGCDNPDIDVDKSGNIHCVFTTATIDGYAGPAVYLRSMDGGTTWNLPVELEGGFSLVPDAGCRLHTIYPDIYHLMSPDTGWTWNLAQQVFSDFGARPSVDAYGIDTIAFAWSTYLYSSGDQYEIYLMRSTDGGSVWQPRVQISVNAGSGPDIHPNLAFDSYGGMHVVWEDWGIWGACYCYVSPECQADSIFRLTDLPTLFNFPHIHCGSKDRVHVAWVQQPLDTTVNALYYRRGTLITGVDERDTHAHVVSPLVVYPSVFSQVLHIGSTSEEHSTIAIYDACGRRVRIFNGVSGRTMYTWNVRDENGKRAPPGVYFVQLELNNDTYVKKVVCLR